MSSVESPTILFVDDDERYRAQMQRAFARRGFACAIASSGAEALALARSCAFDHASVDLRMPGMNGLDLVRELIALRPELYVVVLTGFGSIATAVEAVRLGAKHYLTKPADASDLLTAFARTDPGRTPIAHEVPSLARAEWEHIQRVLDDCGGNISQAARLLRIERRSLQRKLQKHPVPK
jgi:two-component system, response regulator RegA